MRKLALIFSFAFLILHCSATPVLFSLQALNGSAANRTILVTPDPVTPATYGTNLVPLTSITLQPVGGSITTNLLSWGYTVRVDGWSQGIHIIVPTATNTINVVTLINTNAFIGSNIYLPGAFSLGGYVPGTNGNPVAWMLGLDAFGNLASNAVPTGGSGGGSGTITNALPTNAALPSVAGPIVFIPTNYDSVGAAQSSTNVLGSAAWKSIGFFDLFGAAQNATNGLVNANLFVTHTDGYNYTNTSGVYMGTFGGGPSAAYFADGVSSLYDSITGGSNGLAILGNIELPATNFYFGNGKYLSNLPPTAIVGNAVTNIAAGGGSTNLLGTTSGGVEVPVPWSALPSSGGSMPNGVVTNGGGQTITNLGPNGYQLGSGGATWWIMTNALGALCLSNQYGSLTLSTNLCITNNSAAALIAGLGLVQSGGYVYAGRLNASVSLQINSQASQALNATAAGLYVGDGASHPVGTVIASNLQLSGSAFLSNGFAVYQSPVTTTNPFAVYGTNGVKVHWVDTNNSVWFYAGGNSMQVTNGAAVIFPDAPGTGFYPNYGLVESGGSFPASIDFYNGNIYANSNLYVMGAETIYGSLAAGNVTASGAFNGNGAGLTNLNLSTALRVDCIQMWKTNPTPTIAALNAITNWNGTTGVSNNFTANFPAGTVTNLNAGLFVLNTQTDYQNNNAISLAVLSNGVPIGPVIPGSYGGGSSASDRGPWINGLLVVLPANTAISIAPTNYNGLGLVGGATTNAIMSIYKISN